MRTSCESIMPNGTYIITRLSLNGNLPPCRHSYIYICIYMYIYICKCIYIYIYIFFHFPLTRWLFFPLFQPIQFDIRKCIWTHRNIFLNLLKEYTVTVWQCSEFCVYVCVFPIICMATTPMLKYNFQIHVDQLHPDTFHECYFVRTSNSLH